MGSTYQFGCKACGYEKHIHTGIGMMYSPERINSVNDDKPFLQELVRSKKIFNTVKGLINSKHGEIKCGHYDLTLYRCTRCNEFYERFHFELDFLDGTYEPEYKCWRCKGNLEVLHIEEKSYFSELDYQKPKISSYPCPSCGEMELSDTGFDDGVVMMIMNWD